jgi:hypothetical protein
MALILFIFPLAPEFLTPNTWFDVVWYLVMQQIAEN